MRARAGAAAAMLACCTTLVAGCSLLPVEENTFGTTVLPATTDANAVTVLATLDEAWSAADAARDPALLAEVIAEPLLAIDAAGYALDATTDPDDATPAEPVRHTDPTVFIPRFAGYPQWFVVAAAAHADGSPQLAVLTRTDAAAPWVVPIAPELLPDVAFPVLALDDRGYVVPLRSDTLGDLPIGAQQLAELHAGALSGEVPAEPPATPSATPAAATTTSPPATTPPAPTAPATTAPATTAPATATPTPTATAPPAEPEVVAAMTTALAADPWSAARTQADAAAAEAVGVAATIDSTYAVGTVLDQALRTEDGGALVFYALTGQRAYAVTPTYYLQLDATTAALVGKPEVSAELTETWAAQLAVYIPPDPDGVPRVVAARWDRTGLSGS